MPTDLPPGDAPVTPGLYCPRGKYSDKNVWAAVLGVHNGKVVGFRNYSDCDDQDPFTKPVAEFLRHWKPIEQPLPPPGREWNAVHNDDECSAFAWCVGDQRLELDGDRWIVVGEGWYDSLSRANLRLWQACGFGEG